MKTSSAKAKGRVLQQFCAKLIAEKFGLKEDDVVSRPMGSGGADLMMSSSAQKEFPVTLECKNWKTKPGPEAVEQAKHNAYKGTVGAVAWKPPRKGFDKTLIMMELTDFLQLILVVEETAKEGPEKK